MNYSFRQVVLNFSITLVVMIAIAHFTSLSRAVPLSSTNQIETIRDVKLTPPLFDNLAFSAQPPGAMPEPIGSSANLIDHSKTAQLVDIRTVNPMIGLDMRYATANNFLKRKVYPQARCLLRASVAKRLAAVQQDLEKQGLGLKVYDCYRPLSVQKEMWKLFPDGRYVADPARGSRHNRGSAVDLTLVTLKTKKELPMPTGFDDFSDRAHLDYQGGTADSRKNRETLQQSMKNRGFLPLQTEWWHFDAPNWQDYSLVDVPLSQIR